MVMPDASSNRATTRPKPGWEKLQNNLNDILRKISIEGSELFLSLVVDDDKIWLQNSSKNAKNRFKLKMVRHTRDNREGLNAHTVATSALTMPVNIQFETVGDSAVQCYKRAMAYITNADGNTIADVNMESLTDRGYTSLERVKENLLCGRDYLGTVARSHDWGFTYDQVPRSGDKRRHIQMSGTASLFCKEANIGFKKLTLAAFKNGSGSVSMAISSKHHGHCWDGIPLGNNSTHPTENDYVTVMNFHDTSSNSTPESKQFVLDHMETEVVDTQQNRVQQIGIYCESSVSHPRRLGHRLT